MMSRVLMLLLLAGGAIAWPWTKPDVAPIVHLFEWKFSDIARECKEFLGPLGFQGIQISPVNEYLIAEGRPWWERYQPMSYQIISRSGNETEFRKMVQACNEAKVRVYVDVVINHMSASQGNATGTSGVITNTDNKTYVNVPYTSENFHSTCEINDYYNATNVRMCELVGLHDLDQSQSYVRKMIIGYLNKLIDIGVGGFRVDAAKHVWPQDLEYIYSKLHYLNRRAGFPLFSKPFIYQEVVDYGGEAIKGADYAYIGHVCEFRYGNFLGEAFRGIRPLSDLLNISKVAVESKWLNSSDAVVFVENHDSERSGGNTLTYRDGTNYTMAVAFLLSWDYGTPKIMSSFYFDNHDQGPPHNSNYTIADVTVDSNGTCTNGWVCQHRWRPIAAMARFRDVVSKQPVTKVWKKGNNQIAFTRGNVGFIAFNARDTDMIENINTGMPSGTYCDIISGGVVKGKCAGLTVNVDRSGNANITISTAGDRVVAIHALSKLWKQ